MKETSNNSIVTPAPDISRDRALASMQDDDLTLVRAYADAVGEQFNDVYLFKLEVKFRNNGVLSVHDWSVLQGMINKYDMHNWETRGNK